MDAQDEPLVSESTPVKKGDCDSGSETIGVITSSESTPVKKGIVTKGVILISGVNSPGRKAPRLRRGL